MSKQISNKKCFERKKMNVEQNVEQKYTTKSANYLNYRS